MQKSNNISRSRFSSLNGNARSTLSEVFNLDQKRSYKELIKRVADNMKPDASNKPFDIFSLASDAASLRLTQKAQRNALNDIKFVDKGLSTDTLNETSSEYDPITVASINSYDSEVEVIPSETSTTSSTKIDRINSLKEHLKNEEVFSDQWLSNLDSRYKKINRERKQKIADVKRESDIISKVNYEQRVKHLERRLKTELSLPESLIEEPQPTEKLPVLTKEQELLVKKALGPGPTGQLLIEKFNLRIHRFAIFLSPDCKKGHIFLAYPVYL